jgi:hypothetical protein
MKQNLERPQSVLSLKLHRVREGVAQRDVPVHLVDAQVNDVCADSAGVDASLDNADVVGVGDTMFSTAAVEETLLSNVAALDMYKSAPVRNRAVSKTKRGSLLRVSKSNDGSKQEAERESVLATSQLLVDTPTQSPSASDASRPVMHHWNKSGSLFVRSNRSLLGKHKWNQRHVMLGKASLEFYLETSHKGTCDLLPASSVELMPRLVAKRPFCFVIRSGNENGEQVLVATESEGDTESWLDAISHNLKCLRENMRLEGRHPTSPVSSRFGAEDMSTTKVVDGDHFKSQAALEAPGDARPSHPSPLSHLAPPTPRPSHTSPLPPLAPLTPTPLRTHSPSHPHHSNMVPSPSLEYGPPPPRRLACERQHLQEPRADQGRWRSMGVG